ncbi:protein FAM217A isoform X2 [Mauremys reevesii]|uniref:protein FAM217A isoform X2 n=2 Tax=Mauremys reevesii TaxID=260615 RepID=UPI00193FC6C8|nr:protein FAM217A isoform X2 [Mauremys reevesii]
MVLLKMWSGPPLLGKYLSPSLDVGSVICISSNSSDIQSADQDFSATKFCYREGTEGGLPTKFYIATVHSMRWSRALARAEHYCYLKYPVPVHLRWSSDRVTHLKELQLLHRIIPGTATAIASIKSNMRDSNKPLVEKLSSSHGNSLNFFTVNPTFVGAYMNSYHRVSYRGPQQMPLGIYWTNGDGDFFKARNETTAFDSYPATESSSDDTLCMSKWNLKLRNSSVENSLLPEEGDVSESEKANDDLLSYFKYMDLNLRPETIEKIEKASSKHQNEVFPYPDFLPPPFNNLDLQKLALSKWDDWKEVFNPPPESSVVKLISRLLEIERMQHLTILKEKTRDLTVSSSMMLGNRPSSTKSMHQLKQSSLSDPLCLQTPFNRDYQEKNKSNHSSCCMHEWNSSKCTWEYCRHCKWSAGTSSIRSSSTKQLRASCDAFKSSKAPIILNSNMLLRRSSSCCVAAPRTQSTVKLTSPKLLPPSRAITSPFPDKDSLKYKQPRTKRKLYRKNVVTSKTFHCQKLKSVSAMPKQKYTHTDKQ